jgi:DNA replication protein DnaC
MLIEQTIEQLHAMNLSGMAKAYRQQGEQASISELSFEERFGLLVEQEWLGRQNRQMAKLLTNAKLRQPACLENIEYHPRRKLDKLLIARLATCQWITNNNNVLISGATGTGKSYMVCALGNAACRQGLSTRYYRVSRLISDIVMAKGTGSYQKLLRSLAKYKVLILDDWGLQTFTGNESRELFEIIEERSQCGSTVIASQLPVEKWYETLTDPTIADAIMDRIIHNAYRINIEGDTMRRYQAKDLHSEVGGAYYEPKND